MWELPNATTQYTFEDDFNTPRTSTVWNLTETATTFSGAATPCPLLLPAPVNANCDSLAEVLDLPNPVSLSAWNTGIDCASLSAGYLYCVANPSSTLWEIPTPPVTGTGPQPQQPGMVETCHTYWFVAGYVVDFTSPNSGAARGEQTPFLLTWNLTSTAPIPAQSLPR